MSEVSSSGGEYGGMNTASNLSLCEVGLRVEDIFGSYPRNAKDG
jgi:hypothetical protein